MSESAEPFLTDVAAREALVRRGREAGAAGDLDEAWRLCVLLADLGRRSDDATALADAATLLRPQHFSPVTALVNGLCAEAMARIDALDPLRAARVRAQFVATMDPADERRAELGPELLDTAPLDEAALDPELQFLRLQARYSLAQHPSQVRERLTLGQSALDLGRRVGVPEYTCWGHRWRMDAFSTLGNRVDVVAERMALMSVARALANPTWDTFVSLSLASQHHLEGRFPEATTMVARALELTGPDSEVAFFGTVFDFAIARFTGAGLEETLQAVSGLSDTLPFLARAWTCRVLMSLHRRDEADLLWRAVAAHLDRLSPQLPEWLVANAGNAEVCAWLDDRQHAVQLYDALAPYEELHVHGAHTPYDGPVALQLGRLARTLGHPEVAREHFDVALRMSLDIHSPPYVCASHVELADVLSPAQPEAARGHAVEAARLASRFGLQPLAARAAALDAQLSKTPTLTPREAEILELVAADLSNREIAQRLVLSERTIEAHVSHILRKLGAESRVGLAVWHAKHRR